MADLTNGLVVMTPSSVVKTGTGSTATINSDGSVTFTSCATLSLNGVFTASYDNYMVAVREVNNTGEYTMRARVRLSGTDSTSTADYNGQSLGADSTTIAAGRSTTNGYWNFMRSGNAQRCGGAIYLFGPSLAQPTAYRAISVGSYLSAELFDNVGTHGQSTAYDGLTIFPSVGLTTGLVTVFAFNQ